MIQTLSDFQLKEVKSLLRLIEWVQNEQDLKVNSKDLTLKWIQCDS